MTTRAVDEIEELVEVIQEALAGIIEAGRRMQAEPTCSRTKEVSDEPA